MELVNFNIFKKIAARGMGKNLGDVINVSAAVSTPIGLAGFVVPDATTRTQEKNLKKQEMIAQKLQKDAELKRALANSTSKQVLEQIQPPPLPPGSLASKKEYIYR